MNRAGRSSVLLVLIAGSLVCAQPVDSLPSYQPQTKISGTIRVWGSVQMGSLMQYWQRGFSKYQPSIRFENHLNGALGAIASLYTGVADLAISREIWPVETMAFEQVIGYRPTAVQVATGSFDVPTKSDSLEIFVHKDNPITGVTLAQLGALFASEPLRDAKNVHVWGDLGLTGKWTDKPARAYGYKVENAAMMFFRDIVLKPGTKWNCELREFGNESAAGGTRVDAGLLILEALAKDPYGIAISNVRYARGELKALPVAAGEGKPFVAPTRENVLNRTYPLTRAVYFYLNRAPGKPLDSKVAEFLHYVLSREGRRDVISEGAYLPLPVKMLREQLAGSP